MEKNSTRFYAEKMCCFPSTSVETIGTRPMLFSQTTEINFCFHSFTIGKRKMATFAFIDWHKECEPFFAIFFLQECWFYQRCARMATKPHCFQSSFSGNHHHWKDRGIKHFQYILRFIWHISKTTFQPTCYFLALLLSQRSSTQFYHFEREFFGRLERTTR